MNVEKGREQKTDINQLEAHYISKQLQITPWLFGFIKYAYLKALLKTVVKNMC